MVQLLNTVCVWLICLLQPMLPAGYSSSIVSGQACARFPNAWLPLGTEGRANMSGRLDCSLLCFQL